MSCWPGFQPALGRERRSRLGRSFSGFIFGFVAALSVLVHPGPVSAAEPRVALVIGNGDYDNSIGRLRNPTNDAKLIAATLQSLGFKVMLETDVDQKEMKRAIRDFGAALRDAGPAATGLFYYAGHGVQVDGVNYLLPLGAHIAAEADVEIEAISADSVLAQMQYAENKVNLVFLDACRNNPLTRGFRSSNRGLARVDAPRGSFIGYSTAPGDVSVDGDAGNSPYTQALAEEMRRPGSAIEEVHRAVRLRVLSATGNKQTPWDSSSLTASVVLAPEAAAPVIAAAPAMPPISADPEAEKDLWKSIANSNNPAVFEAYLKQFPNGAYAGHANVRLAALREGQTPALDVAPNQIAAAQTAAAQAPAIIPPAPAAAPEPVAIASVAPAEMTRHLAVKNANIRAEPNTKAKVVGKLRSGDAIVVTGNSADGDWLRVTGPEGEGFVSRSLLMRDPNQPIAAPKVAAPPAPPPAPKANTLVLAASLREEIERFLANSQEFKSNYRFLAVNAAGDHLGTSTNCKIKKTGWGGFSASDCNEATSREAAIKACGRDCRIIFDGTRKVGDFELAWTDGASAPPVAEPAAPVAAPVAEPAAESVSAPAQIAAVNPEATGGVLRLSESIRADVEKFLANSEEFKTNYRFLAVNNAGDRIGTSTNCKIKKTGWGGFSASGCNEESSREAAIEACGRDCRVIYDGTRKVGDFRIEWQ